MNKSLYLLEDGELVKRDDSLLFINEKEEEIQIPLVQITEIFFCGKNKWSYDCLKIIADNGITVHFFNRFQYYLGSFYPKEEKYDGSILIGQVSSLADGNKRISYAREFLIGGFKNIYRNLRYYAKRKEFIIQFNITQCVNEIENASNINHLMMIEAKWRKKYYLNFLLIMEDALQGEKFIRTYPNSKNIINILLNFLNSLLYAIILSEFHKTHLNSTLGYLHIGRNGHLALVYDISEVFKPLFVDRLLFTLLNKKEISEADIDADNKLTRTAVGKIFTHWDRNINNTIYHRLLKRNVSYRYLIRQEIYNIEKSLSTDYPYKSFVLWW
jgi:CRISPR-associated protein Cas1